MLPALALLAAAPLVAPAIATPSVAERYAVILEVTTDANGAVASVTVNKVIDASSGSTEAIAVRIPDGYVAAARARIEERATAKPVPSKTYYTYFFYDPRMPHLVLTSPL